MAVTDNAARPLAPIEGGTYLYQGPDGKWVPVAIMDDRMYLLMLSELSVNLRDCPGALHGPLRKPGSAA